MVTIVVCLGELGLRIQIISPRGSRTARVRPEVSRARLMEETARRPELYVFWVRISLILCICIQSKVDWEDGEEYSYSFGKWT